MSPPVQILGGTCPPCPIGIDASAHWKTSSCRRIVTLASALNVLKLYAQKGERKRFFCHPTVFDAQLLRNPLEHLRQPYTA